MRVDRAGDEWVVIDDAGQERGRFETSGQAWHAADRLAGEVTNVSEKRADYRFRQAAMNSNAKFPHKPKPPKQAKAAKRSKHRRPQREPSSEFRFERGLGTLGHASPVRRIDPRNYHGGAK